MKRLLSAVILLSLLAACGINPFKRGADPDVIGQSIYCGTPSQDAAVHYFDQAAAFGDWLEYRSIAEFDAEMASAGLVVVEMGQRPTGGYHLKMDASESRIDGDTLKLRMTWNAPRLDAAVSQALTSPCVAIKPPKGDFDRIEVRDQLDNLRGEVRTD